jgi:hypothetical protein
MGAGALKSTELSRPLADATTHEEISGDQGTPHTGAPWSAENFAREQIRGLVRQVFFSNAVHLTRQVVVSALEPETEVRNICRRMGEALAMEITERVAVVGAYPRVIHLPESQHEDPDSDEGNAPLRQMAARTRKNLWLVPYCARGPESGLSASRNAFLNEVRRQFEYSIVHGPIAGESDEATAMAQAADGIILVLSAHRTRRATALRVKQSLETVRANILGTVLSDREFPIPDVIYRRL